ncbi:MAG: hypothetical protein IK036_00455 [Clostridia bacterium]|nr:hypothetical protein [Clostridia bacterium]MBR5991206.1 hypothetical protein [Clostridia bacterium]MBR6479033.1 hypothetical protein [Clostridia bacterium]MBR6512797.1 hypothetical protein [Clostridia bacterium]
MSVFTNPVHLPDPSFTELYSGKIEFFEDIENTNLAPGGRKSFRVKNGSVSGKVNAEIVPVVSTLWKSVDAAGAVSFESKFVAKPNKLATISCDVYGRNTKMLSILPSTGWPGYTWLAHIISFIRVDKVEGNTVTFTAIKVE